MGGRARAAGKAYDLAMEDGGPIRVLVAENEWHYADALDRHLSNEGDIEVVDIVDSADAAVERAAALSPDAVLLDILDMGEMRSVEACKKIVANDPRIAVVVVTVDDSPASKRAFLTAGARGYLVKKDRRDPLRVAEALRVAVRGGVALDAALQSTLREMVSSLPKDPMEAEGLTPREREILPLVAAGLSNKQIGEALYISKRTAEKHVASLRRKLRAANRTELTAIALRRHMIS